MHLQTDYRALRQAAAVGFGANFLGVAVRTASDPMRTLPVLRQTIQELDRDVPVAAIATMEQNIANSMGQRRFADGEGVGSEARTAAIAR